MSLLQLQFTSQTLRPSSHNFRSNNKHLCSSKRVSFVRTKIRAVSTVPEKDSDSDTELELLDIDDPNKPPYVGFVFVSVSSTIFMLHFHFLKLIYLTLDFGGGLVSLCCCQMEHQTCTFVLLVAARSLGRQ